MVYHKGPSNHREASHMKMRQVQNIEQSRYSRAEAWAADKLDSTGLKWTRQSIRGWRVFDFWNHRLGIAVEIDGKEHDPIKDARNDANNWKVSRIVVIRVKNFDEDDMDKALKEIAESKTWNERREEAGMKLITT